MPDYQHWLLEEEAHTATLTLNRPEVMNALVPQTLYELRDLTAYLRTRRDVWAIVVQGRGKHFSAGMDVNMILGRLDRPGPENQEFVLGLQQCLDDFEALQKPTIAKLKGFCIGGGLLLALCCDFRIASQRTVFSLPEVRLGLGVIMGTQRVTRVAGLAVTKELILLGKRFRAGEALSYGLVTSVVPPDELDAAVVELARKFQSLPPRTVGTAKRIIDAGYHLSIRESQDLEIDGQTDLMDSPDFREALESYLEQRQPHFSGQ